SLLACIWLLAKSIRTIKRGTFVVRCLPTRIRPSSSGMPPPSPSAADQISVSPSTRRELASSASHIPRYGYEAHRMPGFVTNPPSSSVPSAPRSNDSLSYTMSSSAYGQSNTSQGGDMSAPAPMLASQDSVPPFAGTRTFVHKVVAANASQVTVEIDARIDKGFFKSDQDWTCYRRNYFSVACSYSLKPYNPKMEPFSIQKSPGQATNTIQSFAMCISARVDSEEGKSIELVQHTPKRDKGPTGQPERIRLRPHTSSSYGVYSEATDVRSGLSSDYETAYAPTSPGNQQSQTMTSFDRIQFKNATANNGKRRAAQQYFHIVVELYGETSEGQWVKIASRISAPMVVRGRSPGHYSDDRRGSSTSMGPGDGSSGDSAGSQRDPHSGSSGVGRSGIAGLFTTPSRMGGGGSGHYTGHNTASENAPGDDMSDHSSSSSSEGGKVEMMGYEGSEEMILTPEEEDNIENHEGYQYYPSTLFEAPTINNTPRPLIISELQQSHHLDAADGSNPHGNTRGGSNITSGNALAGSRWFNGAGIASRSYHEPQYTTSPTSANPNGGISSRGCGRFQGVDTSRGWYPATPAL
ncbi:MAG: hypothetical protein Q9183_003257, partial [Haloplaca sp. 2 TL-2023]